MGDDREFILGDCRTKLAERPAGFVDLVAVDPPYGIKFRHARQAHPSERNPSASVVKWASIAGDSAVDPSWLPSVVRAMKPGAALYLVTRWDVEPEWREHLRAAGLIVKQRLTWHKRDHGKGDLRGTWATTCEDVLFATKGRHVMRRRPSMLIDAGCVHTRGKRYHPHQKPEKLYEAIIEASSAPGDLVMDPMAGSATAAIVCAKMGRKFLGFEIDPQVYADATERLAMK